MEETWFKEWFNTPYYHQLYKERNDDEAVFFIDKLINKLMPPAQSKMLDVACGKGRHSIQLASKGFDVTGIDLSPQSIRYAKQSESSNLQFFEHDMRMPLMINYFDFAFNFFTSFGYFKTNRENENAIKSISSALKPNGIFVMDYLNVENKMLITEGESEKTIENNLFQIKKWKDTRFFYKQINIQDNNNNSSCSFTENVAIFSLPDFKAMFEKNGLIIKTIYGDYSLKPFDADHSPRLIMVAQKQL